MGMLANDNNLLTLYQAICMLTVVTFAGADIDVDPKLASPLLPTQQSIALAGYQVETYQVFSKDGAIIGMHRIIGHKDRSSDAPRKGVVLLLPGAFTSSYMWIFRPKNSLAFFLVERGYEVWVADLRGESPMVRKHVTPMLGPKKWRFTLDDMSQYDIPACIDKALSVSGFKEIHVVTYSMGSTVMLQLLADSPEYNEKVVSLTVLAPAVFVSKYDMPVRVLIKIPFAQSLFKLLVLFSTTIPFLKEYFTYKIATTKNTEFTRDWVKNEAVIKSFLTRFKLVSSLVGLQFYQTSMKGRLSKFDYGRLLNRLKYGQAKAPEYKLGNIKTPVMLLAGKNDEYVTKNGREYTIDALNSLRKELFVDSTPFSHMSFLFTNGMNEKVNKPVYDFIEEIRGERNHNVTTS